MLLSIFAFLVLSVATQVVVRAKGCDPYCTTFELESQAPSTGAEVGLRVVWLDDRGKRVRPSPEVYDSHYSVFVWRLEGLPDELANTLSAPFMDRAWRIRNGITEKREDRLWTPINMGGLHPDQYPPLEVKVQPFDGLSHRGTIRLRESGLWIAQVRPFGAWPSAPWGTDLVVLRVPTAGNPLGTSPPPAVLGNPEWELLILLGLAATTLIVTVAVGRKARSHNRTTA
jgi:hypothetical protein